MTLDWTTLIWFDVSLWFIGYISQLLPPLSFSLTSIPLVPRRPASPDADIKVGATPSKEKKDKKAAKKGAAADDAPGAESPAPPQDLDEKLLYDGYTFAVNAISQMVRRACLVNAEDYV